VARVFDFVGTINKRGCPILALLQAWGAMLPPNSRLTADSFPQPLLCRTTLTEDFIRAIMAQVATIWLKPDCPSLNPLFHGF